MVSVVAPVGHEQTARVMFLRGTDGIEDAGSHIGGAPQDGKPGGGAGTDKEFHSGLPESGAVFVERMPCFISPGESGDPFRQFGDGFGMM